MSIRERILAGICSSIHGWAALNSFACCPKDKDPARTFQTGRRERSASFWIAVAEQRADTAFAGRSDVRTSNLPAKAVSSGPVAARPVPLPRALQRLAPFLSMALPASQFGPEGLGDTPLRAGRMSR